MELKKLHTWYNPFYVKETKTDKFTPVNNILVFDESEGKILVTVGRGWFGSNNSIENLTLGGDVLKKRVIDLTCKENFIVKAKEDNYSTEIAYDLYINNKYFDLSAPSYSKNNSLITTEYHSNINKELSFINVQTIKHKIRDYREELKTLVESISEKSDINSITVEINSLLEKLKAEQTRVKNYSIEDYINENKAV